MPAIRTHDIIPRHDVPEILLFASRALQKRAQGKPDASRTGSLVCDVGRKAHKLHSPQDWPTSGFPCATGVDAIVAKPIASGPHRTAIATRPLFGAGMKDIID
jgi:hypothetical protein